MLHTTDCGCYDRWVDLDGHPRARLRVEGHAESCLWAAVDKRLRIPCTTIEIDARHSAVVWTLPSDDAEHATEERIEVYRKWANERDPGATLRRDRLVGATRETAIARVWEIIGRLGLSRSAA